MHVSVANPWSDRVRRGCVPIPSRVHPACRTPSPDLSGRSTQLTHELCVAGCPPMAGERAVLARGVDGVRRCAWGGSTPEYIEYHDREWGRPVVDDTRIYEKLCL